jgi:hypothetical protein
VWRLPEDVCPKAPMDPDVFDMIRSLKGRGLCRGHLEASRGVR